MFSLSFNNDKSNHRVRDASNNKDSPVSEPNRSFLNGDISLSFKIVIVPTSDTGSFQHSSMCSLKLFEDKSKSNRSNDESSEYTSIRSNNHGNSSTRAFLCLGLIFIAAVLAIGVLYLSFPNLDQEEKQHIKLPRDIEDAKSLGKVLSRYKELYYYQVLFGYFITYIFLQSFAIPGSIFLSILSGFLFPFPLALTLVCLCSATGASFCYLLSYLVGRALVNKYIPERVSEWSSHVEKHRQHLLNYIIFLRITPFLPNWFINITSPVINVPLFPFFVGTFLGVAPPSFVAIQAGTTLQQMSSSGDAVSWTSMIVLALFAILSLLPVFFKRTLQKKFD
ncbi:transmembrane protein 41B-like isoform X2 [Lineus longissimus]|uniref:transmembrane protein 41B-like isoform X2 n=1 Tax=Lineus longissimus TaxID=88925 RepID=UPI002B4D30A8